MSLVELVQRALEEDIGQGDITTNSTIDAEANDTAFIRSKEELVVCGHLVAREVFRQMGASYKAIVNEGVLVPPLTVIAEVSGNTRALLTGERVALNFLMKLSGIATNTFRIISGIEATFRIVDTRKTTPLLREQERRAVQVGGGKNHRFALYDGILIKDNHISSCGSITNAIKRAKENAHHLLKIEIEVEDKKGLKEAIEAGADVVMLDNMTNKQLVEAVAFNKGRVLLEASGNMNRTRLQEIQSIGIDVVSIGGLIHQARWVDLSMKMR